MLTTDVTVRKRDMKYSSVVVLACKYVKIPLTPCFRSGELRENVAGIFLHMLLPSESG